MTSAPTKRAGMIVREQEPYNAEPSRAALAERLITPVEVFCYGNNSWPTVTVTATSTTPHPGSCAR